MKKTGSLKVSISTAVPRNHLVLHPNEGFDLGLMRVGHPLLLCRNIGLEEYLKGGVGEIEEVHIDLLNECPRETLLMGLGLHKVLGEPAKAVMLFDGERIFVHRT